MNRPTILIVDDHPSEERAKLQNWNLLATVNVLHPQDVTIDDLQNAHVAVVDYRLDDSWLERDQLDCIALKPMNGLALLQVFKSHECSTQPPTAFVLRSGHLSDLTSGRSPDTRLHTIARQHSLEWVLEKGVNDTQLQTQLQQICSLATAVANLPQHWPTGNQEVVLTLFKEWLQLKTSAWESLAFQDIEDCNPPIHDLGNQRDGMRLVRWMTQRILPYPCFLMNESRLATRLKVTLESLQHSLANGLKDTFLSAQYSGALHDFNGDCWWRSGLESVLWELSEGRSYDTSYLLGKLNAQCGVRLTPLKIEQPVLCLNNTLGWSLNPIDISQAVRIQPDDWPVFAEPAWASLEEANEHPQLAAAVISADRDKLSLSLGNERNG